MDFPEWAKKRSLIHNKRPTKQKVAMFPGEQKITTDDQEVLQQFAHEARRDAWMLRCEVLENDNLPSTKFEVFDDENSSRHAGTQCTKNAIVAAPMLQPLETREFILDSGASFHLISKKDLSPSEEKTIRTANTPIALNTAN